MLLGAVLTGLYMICTLYAAGNGRAEAAGRALMEGAQAAVPFVIGIAGGICLWSGVLELLERSGAAGALARALRRPLRRLFPRSTEQGEILEALTEKRWEKLLVHLRRRDADLSALPGICGFRSAAALRELFRRRTGMSMTEWRRKNG